MTKIQETLPRLFTILSLLLGRALLGTRETGSTLHVSCRRQNFAANKQKTLVTHILEVNKYRSGDIPKKPKWEGKKRESEMGLRKSNIGPFWLAIQSAVVGLLKSLWWDLKCHLRWMKCQNQPKSMGYPGGFLRQRKSGIFLTWHGCLRP